jgi:hypothetical protein
VSDVNEPTVSVTLAGASDHRGVSLSPAAAGRRRRSRASPFP